MTSGDDRYTIRTGRASDGPDLARLQASTQMQWITGGEPHAGIAAWVEGLFDGHPSAGPEDFLVAYEVASGRPVGSLVDLRQTWTLGGVRLPVSQVELVATAPEHRGNRLTERLFAALHQRFAADGVAVQMIEGIPYFYRRLGYDYALANDGAAVVPAAALPAAPAAPAQVPVTTVGAGTASPSYDAAVDDLEQILAEGRGRLDTATVRVLEENLALIDRAIAQARRAVAADSANLYLNTHLAETMRRKIDLLRQAAALVSAVS